MIINIEYIKFLKDEMHKINALDLDDIDFHEDGESIEISKKAKYEFEFTGLNNIDFITSGSYKNKEKSLQGGNEYE